MLPARLRFVAAVGLVAVSAGAFAVIFRATLQAFYLGAFGHANVVDAIASLPPWWRVAPPLAGAAGAGLFARLRRGGGQGVSNVMEAVALGHVRLSVRTTASRVLAAWTAIAGGVSIGREGPLIEVGGTLGAGIGRLLRVPLDEMRVLVAAGTAAGFAAAYNTPFAAVLFVLESIAGIAAPVLLLPVMAAAVGATAILRATIGAAPLYGQRAFGLASNGEFVFVAGLGVAAALAAMTFTGLLQRLERWVERHPLPQPLRAAVGGGLVGLAAVTLPDVVGNGYETLIHLLDTPPATGALLVLLAAKTIVTSSAVASGIPGGVFTPMLLVGAALGAIAGQWLPGTATGSYALVGMAATAAASIHAPLTAAVMVFELTGDYSLALPLILATVVSTATSRALGARSVYDAELHKRGLGWRMTLEGREMTADDGAAGRR